MLTLKTCRVKKFSFTGSNLEQKEKKEFGLSKKVGGQNKSFFSSTYFAISDNWSFPSLLESKTCNIVSVY